MEFISSEIDHSTVWAVTNRNQYSWDSNNQADRSFEENVDTSVQLSGTPPVIVFPMFPETL